MTNYIYSHELIIRLSAFIGIFVLMYAWQTVKPRRKLLVSLVSRQSNNLGIVVINTILLRVLFPLSTVGLAFYAYYHGWGLLNNISLPTTLKILISIIFLDLVIYIQHVMFHKVSFLWRLHCVHHADLEIDVTTGIRFHPIEIILSMLIKWFSIISFGIPALAIIGFEVILNATALFNHSNIDLPSPVDRIIRLFLVTPDMHRIHHSTIKSEMNSNFGFNLPWWDRLFGTYKKNPKLGHLGMTIGLEALRDPNQVNRLLGMLALPLNIFKKLTHH